MSLNLQKLQSFFTLNRGHEAFFVGEDDFAGLSLLAIEERSVSDQKLASVELVIWRAQHLH